MLPKPTNFISKIEELQKLNDKVAGNLLKVTWQSVIARMYLQLLTLLVTIFIYIYLLLEVNATFASVKMLNKLLVRKISRTFHHPMFPNPQG